MFILLFSHLPKEFRFELSNDLGDIDSSSENSSWPCEISRDSGIFLNKNVEVLGSYMNARQNHSMIYLLGLREAAKKKVIFSKNRLGKKIIEGIKKRGNANFFPNC